MTNWNVKFFLPPLPVKISELFVSFSFFRSDLKSQWKLTNLHLHKNELKRAASRRQLIEKSRNPKWLREKVESMNGDRVEWMNLWMNTNQCDVSYDLRLRDSPVSRSLSSQYLNEAISHLSFSEKILLEACRSDFWNQRWTSSQLRHRDDSANVIAHEYMNS